MGRRGGIDVIILEDLLGTINSAEAVTIELRDEETNALIDWWYELPSLLLMLEDVKRVRHAFVNEIEVDITGEMLITILVSTGG
ncbi:hypothetical protein NNG48_07295 [Enterococcus faecium]|nr:hypothetical protein [Enterococcus faecium]